MANSASFQSSLKPLFITYRFYGLNLIECKDDSSTFGNTIKSCIYYFIGICHIFMTFLGILILAANMILIYLFSLGCKCDVDDLVKLMPFMTSMGLMSIEVLIYEFALVKKRALYKQFCASLNEFFYILQPQDLNKLRKLSVFICCLPFAVVITVGIGLTFTILDSMPELDKFLSEVNNSNFELFAEENSTFEMNYFFNSTGLLDSDFFISFYFFLNFGYFYAVIIMVFAVFYLVHLKGFVLLFCIILKRMFEALRDYCFQRSLAVNDSAESRSLFIETHKKICQLVATADDLYARTTFLSYGIEISTVVLILRAANLNSWNADLYSCIFDLLIMCIPLGMALTFLVFRTTVLADVNCKIQTSLKYLFCRYDDEQPISLKVYAEILRYVKYSEMAPSLLTGCQCFVISTGCLLSAFGYVLTYTLMLYGIQ
ncbi:hypothetical protein CHUAL_009234 [Chamberlinius hualienensis]